MDKFYQDFQLNNVDTAGFSLEDILAEFRTPKYDVIEDEIVFEHASADFEIADSYFDFDEDDFDMRLFGEEETVPAKQESMYMQDDIMDKEYKAGGELFELDDILSEFDVDPGFTIDPEVEAAGAFVVAEPEPVPAYEPEPAYDEGMDYDDYADDESDDEYIDDFEELKPKTRANKPGIFGFFRSRKSGKLGAMEDEARSIARRALEEEIDAEPEEPDFDIYSYMDEKPYLREEAEEELEEVEHSYEDVAEDVEDYEFHEDYTEEHFEAEFSDLPDLDNGEPHYYEEPEDYYHESGNYEYSLDMGYDADPDSYDREDSRTVYSGVSGDDIEIDSRFNLSGKKKLGNMVYGSAEVDLSADEDYAPTQQLGYAPTQWTADYDDPLAEKVEEAPQRKKHKFVFGKKKNKKAEVHEEYDPYGGTAPADGEMLESFDDFDAAPSDYAEGGEYGEGKKYEEEDMYFPPTFREYVLSIFASVFLRVRGSVRGDTVGTMDDTEEDLGAELSPAAASKYYGSFVKTLKLRLRIAAVLLFILCYVSLELPVPGMLKYLPVASAFCFALQSAIMLMALDVVTTGVLNAFRLKIGADSLAVLACVITGLDAMIVAVSDTAALHMPLCAISSFSVVGLLLAAFLNARGLRKSLRVPAIGKRFYAVTGELKLKAQELTLLKSLRSYSGFVRRSEEATPDETAFIKLGAPIIVLSLILAIITAAVKKSFGDMIYIYSAILCAAVPFTALVSYTLPFFLGSSRIFKSGAAIAGWSGLCDIGTSRNIIITDRDLFPESAITMESVRIFADEDAQKVISYAGSMMQASGACSAACFLELMEENYCDMKQVDGLEFLPGGGMKGVIEGHMVLCGSTELMRLMNVRIPFRLTDKTTVLLAIDGILYGIFSLYYEPLPQVRRALVELVRSSRHPVFAVRDFNINPEMLHNTFDISTDGYDFPPYADRLELSTPTDDKKTRNIAAIICNEGLGPLTVVADVGHRMYVSARTNVFINVIAAVFGMFFVFFKLITAGTLPLGTLLVFMLFASLPVILVSLYVNIKS